MVKVNRVIPFSSVDGPGSRTAVFLQGCNIDCRYCHNPETRKLCGSCGACLAACPAGAIFRDPVSGGVCYAPEKCLFCDSCIRACRSCSSPRVRELTPAETFEEVKKQLPFIRGITVSGGECMLYPAYLTELFTLCKREGLHTLVDSNGTIPFRKHPKLMEVTDGVMLDMKAWSGQDSLKVTGYDNRTVHENMDYLAGIGKLYEVRTVIVPGLFSIEDTVKNTARALFEYRKKNPDSEKIRYKLITYRENGVREQYRIYEPPSGEYMRELKKLAEEQGADPVIIV